MTARPELVHWQALAAAVRSRRRGLGIPTQEAAARSAGVGLGTWHRLESAVPVSDRTLAAVARALGWEPGVPAGILTGAIDGDPTPAPAPGPADLVSGRPALVYLGTDGTMTQLDRADLASLDGRERVLCAALVDHARTRLHVVAGRPGQGGDRG